MAKRSEQEMRKLVAERDFGLGVALVEADRMAAKKGTTVDIKAWLAKAREDQVEINARPGQPNWYMKIAGARVEALDDILAHIEKDGSVLDEAALRERIKKDANSSDGDVRGLYRLLDSYADGVPDEHLKATVRCTLRNVVCLAEDLLREIE